MLKPIMNGDNFLTKPQAVTKMKAWQISGPEGLDALKSVELDEPEVGLNDVLIEMQAWSLNYRDLSMPHGGYPGNEKVKNDPPMIPLSDGAGEVIAVGGSVSRFRVGDRVMPIFFQDWIGGELTEPQIGSALGGAVDGVLAERISIDEQSLVRVPESLNFEQAATLPCAAVTAWQALTLGGLHTDQTVLLLGTGGVSLFALQLLKAHRIRTIITSSSDEKLARAKAMGADELINYRITPEWDQEVLNRTDGVGVDHVLEVGGAGTLEKSMAATRVSGRISLIGVLSGQPDQNPSPMLALFRRQTIQGIYVGSRDMFDALNSEIERSLIEPVIDRTFGFDDAPAAYRHQQSGNQFGKIVVQR